MTCITLLVWFAQELEISRTNEILQIIAVNMCFETLDLLVNLRFRRFLDM